MARVGLFGPCVVRLVVLLLVFYFCRRCRVVFGGFSCCGAVTWPRAFLIIVLSCAGVACLVSCRLPDVSVHYVPPFAVL